MAHLAKAWMLALTYDPGVMPKARNAICAAEMLTMNEREYAHRDALKLTVGGSRRAAVAVLDRLVMSYPRDILAHMAAAFLDAYLGRLPLERDRVGRTLPFWSQDEPGYGIVLGLHGFGLEEAGDYARAEEESREAVDLEPYNFIPHHTVAHVMEMTGRPEDGLGWMTTREPFWATAENGMRSHIWWHKSLFHLELGQFPAALELYDGPILHTTQPLGIPLTDPVSLLWRLDLLGCEVGNRWHELMPICEGHADGRCLVFTDIHAAMVELRSGNEAAVERRLGWMRETAASSVEEAATYKDVGVPLIEGLIAFHRGDYGRAVDLLHRIRYDAWQIGGSRAQRDVVAWTLTEAAVRAGIRDVALALAYERLAARPRSLINRRFEHLAQHLVH